jgi:cation diffusion facilitator family transporter
MNRLLRRLKARARRFAGANDKERAVFVGWSSSSLGLAPTFYAVAVSNSLALFVDALRYAAETLGSLLSWIALRRLGKSAQRYDYGLHKLESVVSLFVALVLFLGAAAAAWNAALRFIEPLPLEGAELGVVFGFVSLVFNLWIFTRNRRVARLERSPIMESQWRLYLAKAVANVAVVAPLGVALLFEGYWTRYLDPASSALLALFVFGSALRLARDAFAELLDESIDDETRGRILAALARHAALFLAVKKLRARRAGGALFVELALYFDDNLSLAETRRRIDVVKNAVASRLPNARVVVEPFGRAPLANAAPKNPAKLVG